MPIIEGTSREKVLVATYDFATHGGAVGDITLSGDNSVGSGAIITGGFLEVLTAPTSGGAATIAVKLEGAGDLVAAAAISGAPWSTTGRKALIPVGAATSVKTTASRSVVITIATAALTDGSFRVVLNYI